MKTTKKITLDLYTKNVVSVSAKQYDTDTRFIEITCVDEGVIFNIDKSTMSAYLRFKKPDNNGVFNEVEITDEAKLRVTLTEQMLAAPGRAIADIFLLKKVYTSNEKPTNVEDIYNIKAPIISVMDFYVNITPTALNHSQIESSYEFNALTNALAQIDYNNKKVVELDKTLTGNENIRNNNESTRQNNEQTRINSENQRINAENIRNISEDKRTKSENERIKQENIRNTSEQQRISSENNRITNENDRKTNENIRKSNESQRQTNETNRISSEDKRLSSETDRQSNETTRQKNESTRQTSENTRISNETDRANAEAERVKNEITRISNENTRNTQETKRQTDTATAITNANNAAKNANDKANDLQNKLDNHHFVLTNELENSVSSTSTTHAPTANAVKIAYDKAVSVENTINSNKNNWNDKYTRNEIDNKFSTLESNIYWKEAVSTYTDIAKTYPNPQDGWTVNVKDTDYTYRYSGTSWIAISANAIPKATQSVDGLLSKEDKTNYDDANSKKHTHSNKSVLDGITSALVATWNTVTNKLDKTGDASNVTNTITTATARTNLTTGEKLSVSLGKIAKFFADLKTVAFTGNYNDLSNKPAIGNGTITIKQAGTNKGTFTMNQSGNTTIELTDSNTTYSNATTSTAGLMSPDDKTALNNLKTGSVIGVKGNSETTYRTGNVNITPANIGLGNVNNTADANKSVKYATTAGSANSITWKNITAKPTSYTPSEHAHISLRANTDNRRVNTIPNDYNGVMKISGLKENSKIGILNNGDYSTVLGIRGWGESSGGNAHEMAFSATGNIFHRHGATTAWNNWKQIAYISDIPTTLPANGGNSDHVYSIDSIKTKRAMTFNWAGKNGQPTWLWGGENAVDMYVYSPTNFNVSSAKYVRDISNDCSLIGIGCGSSRIIGDDDIGHLNAIACYTDSLDDQSDTDEIHYTNRNTFKKWLGIDPLFTTSNDAANIPGGNLNNVVINSEYGVSFTTSHANSTYTNKTAVSINCRDGGVLANYLSYYSRLLGYNNIGNLTIMIDNSADQDGCGVYLANKSGSNTLGLLGGQGKIYCNHIETSGYYLRDFYGSTVTCTYNRTPANDVSFAWSPSERYLRIYIDNTIIATYNCDGVTWI